MIKHLRGPEWLLCFTALATPVAAQESAAVKTARITYLTGASAYVDVGRIDGLREAARVEVVRGGAIIAVLKVTYLASHQASCDIVSTSAALAVGDSVRFAPVSAQRDSSLAARTPRPTPQPAAGRSRPGLRGRVGVEYFATWQRSGTAGKLSDPALQLRIDGPPGGGSPLYLAVDVRARRTRTVLPDGTAVSDGRNRVYQATLALNASESPARFTVGRQISGNLASVGLFDGVMAELNQPDWSGGVFTGSQPEPLRLGWSGSVLELGGYAQRHSRPGATMRWAFTFGASGSYQDAHANREFAFLQGSFSSRRVSTFITQEVDYYRPWKRLPGMQAISPTSTFAIARFRATEQVTLDAGFDSRRNVRLYRDVTNPETAFDDAYRQGAWAGVGVQVTRRFRLGLDARSSSGGPAGHADSYTLSFGAERLTRLGVNVRTRSTRYTNPVLSGWLHATTLSVEPGSWLHLELNGGLRAERDPLADPANFSVTWVGADVDVTLARAWYAMVSATRQRGGVDGYDQVYGGLSFRF
jgi:hypothetical protein